MGTFWLTETDGTATLVVAGETDAEEAIEILHRVAPDLTPGAPLLVDIREARSEALSFKGTHQIATVLSTLGDAYRGRIAVLDGFDDMFEQTQFFEASATIKGVQVRAFISEAAALRWLGEG